MIRTYKSDFRGDCRTERCEQIDSASWLQKHHPDRWPLIWHTPNEAKASPQHMQMRAKQGVKAGVPDIIDAGGPVNGFFELKRLDPRKSALSSEQRDFLQAAADRGHFAAVCYGFEAFKLAYADFLEMIKESA